VAGDAEPQRTVCHTADVSAVNRRLPHILAWLCMVTAAGFGAACSWGTLPASAGTPIRSPHATALPAPKTTSAQNTKFLADVTMADPALATYAQKAGNAALHALLVDGSAFCVLLTRGGGIDDALVAEADGVRNTESRTNLPLSVTTFNTIEAVALLTLCPTTTTSWRTGTTRSRTTDFPVRGMVVRR
jgi:hypothetical protein